MNNRMEIEMENIYPYAAKMLNLGKFGYMHRITNALVKIAETEAFLNDSDLDVRASAVELTHYLKNEIEAEEMDAEERYTDWATDFAA
jgi:hypothetical protein